MADDFEYISKTRLVYKNGARRDGARAGGAHARLSRAREREGRDRGDVGRARAGRRSNGGAEGLGDAAEEALVVEDDAVLVDGQCCAEPIALEVLEKIAPL